MTAERRHSAGLLELPAESNVFHDRDVRKAAQPSKNAAPDKEGLIAAGDTGETRSPIHQSRDQAEPPGIGIEADVETPADGQRGLKGRQNRLSGVRRKQSV